MSSWFWHGLWNGIPTTRYPKRPELAAGVSPGRPAGTLFATAADAAQAAANCPVGAIAAAGPAVKVDLRRCVWCQHCRFGAPNSVVWRDDFEWTAAAATPLPGAFGHSIHVLVVDAGDCGACLNEVKQLNNPFYNMHRLGLFFTATPRAADVLVVVGPVSENMHGPLLKTFAAMPDPKRVLAVGTCAVSGGVFEPSFACAGGVGGVLPVDLEVPGDPPPPLAILHALLQLAGRAPAATSGRQ